MRWCWGGSLRAEPGVKRPHRRAKLQPDRLDRSPASPAPGRADRACGETPGWCAHSATASCFTTASALAVLIACNRSISARCARGSARLASSGLDQRAQGRQFLDPLLAELRRRDPPRGRQHQRALRHQPPQRLARRASSTRHSCAPARAASAPGPAPVSPCMICSAQRPVEPVMRGEAGIWRAASGSVMARSDHSAARRRQAPRRSRRNRAGAAPGRAGAASAGRRDSRGRAAPPPPRRRANGSSRPDARPHGRRHSRAPSGGAMISRQEYIRPPPAVHDPQRERVSRKLIRAESAADAVAAQASDSACSRWRAASFRKACDARRQPRRLRAAPEGPLPRRGPRAPVAAVIVSVRPSKGSTAPPRPAVAAAHRPARRGSSPPCPAQRPAPRPPRHAAASTASPAHRAATPERKAPRPRRTAQYQRHRRIAGQESLGHVAPFRGADDSVAPAGESPKWRTVRDWPKSL